MSKLNVDSGNPEYVYDADPDRSLGVFYPVMSANELAAKADAEIARLTCENVALRAQLEVRQNQQKDIKAKVTFSRVTGGCADYIRLAVNDDASKTEFLVIKMTPEQLGNILSGLAMIDVDAEVNCLDVVGLRKVSESRQLVVDGEIYNREKAALILQEKAQEDGWIIDPYLSSRGSIVTLNGKTIIHYSVYKYVNE